MTISPLPHWKHLHLVGIGGAGMAPLAHFLSRCGFVITGSDRQESAITKFLQSNGIDVSIGHRKENLKDAQALVISSAIDPLNPEYIEALERGIPIQKRAVVLGEIMKKYWTMAIAGTHGKTTTTLMLGTILEAASQDPLIIAGGSAVQGMDGARVGQSSLLVVEADEYDQSFLQMVPTFALITNISDDHMECYGDRVTLDGAFVRFANSIPGFGCVVVCAADAGVAAIVHKLSGKVVSYGFSDDCAYTASGMQSHDKGITYIAHNRKTGEKTSVVLQVPGVHNVLNSLGAFALASEYGIRASMIARGLGFFTGAKRRIEVRGEKDGRLCIDDYAHHPEEVAATLGALKLAYPHRRIVAIFQPHLYTRTQRFISAFAAQLSKADVCCLLPIYASREKPIDGVSSKQILDTMIHTYPQHNTNTLYLLSSPSENTARQIWEKTLPGDVLITMGAGDINQLHSFWILGGA